MKIDEIKKEGLRSIEEFDLAWDEFFKDKPEPKDDDEDKRQQEKFYHWYNYVRKQSDTGKTPSEMYMEIHGEEAGKYPKEPSRIMNFEWGEDYDEENFEDDEEKENERILKEVSEAADEMFDNGVWANSKEEVKDMSRKDASKHMFRLGFFLHARYADYQMKELTKKVGNMTKEEIENMINNLKDEEEKENE